MDLLEKIECAVLYGAGAVLAIGEPQAAFWIAIAGFALMAARSAWS